VIGVIHLGGHLVGYPGVIHGGLLATIMDEVLAVTAMHKPQLKMEEEESENMGIEMEPAVTADLRMKYRKPVWAEQDVVLKGWRVKEEGRKVWVKGTLSKAVDEEEEVLVEAEALFVKVDPWKMKLVKWKWKG